MEIVKIKLLSGGYKGMVIEYIRPRTNKQQKPYIDTIKEERNDPIHLGLDKPLKELRYFLLEISSIISNDMEKMNIDYAIADSEIDAIEIDAKSFVLHGTKKSIVGNKSFKIKTPKITEDDDYHNFDAVMKIIEVIIEETTQYMDGSVVIEDEELALRFIRSGRDKSEEASKYDSLSVEEKRNYLTKVLEGFGSVVYHQSDMVEDTEENNEALSLADDKVTEFTLDGIGELTIDLPTPIKK